jgi:transmembrane sensor
VIDTADPQQLREIRAQAAVWVTDLHGPERNPELEAGFRRWLTEDPRHAEAFELATDSWQKSGDIPLSLVAPVPTPTRKTRTANRARLTLIGAAALALSLAVVFYALTDPTLSTGPAEQRTVELADGTQVTLNANSKITIHYIDAARNLTLDTGEALFNVAHDANRPFSVIIGNRKVTALGTSFDVRREDPQRSDFSVTLIDGRLDIAPLTTPVSTSATAVTELHPGQRLRVAAHTPDTLDTPSIEKITAWQRGLLVFDDIPLRDAAAEFNRYGKRKLTIDPVDPNAIRVSGVFRLSDPLSFAQAIASAHRLRISDTPKEIKLTAP